MIFPELFDGRVMGFFTDREVGTKVGPLVGRPVYTPKQEHTDHVIVLDKDLTLRTGDAVITRRDDIVIGVKTADCVPILLFDPLNGAVGAVHAGWRGTAKSILPKTIQQMTKKYKTNPAELVISIGPAIRWCCYEVGQDVLDAVVKATGKGTYHKKQDGIQCLDLQSANVYQAIASGVRQEHISIIEECTYCYPEKYYSYRFDKSTKGRQGGFIAIP